MKPAICPAGKSILIASARSDGAVRTGSRISCGPANYPPIIALRQYVRLIGGVGRLCLHTQPTGGNRIYVLGSASPGQTRDGTFLPSLNEHLLPPVSRASSSPRPAPGTRF